MHAQLSVVIRIVALAHIGLAKPPLASKAPRQSHAGVGRTVVLRNPLAFFKYLWGSATSSGRTFESIVNGVVSDPEVRSLINMITEGTCSAAPAEIDASYMIRAFDEMWSPKTQLQYPKVFSVRLNSTSLPLLSSHLKCSLYEIQEI
jgi:hypothetical protein